MKRRSSNSKQSRLCSVRSLIGNDVYNHDLDDLGDIKDIVIDVRTGRIGYAVIRCRPGPDQAEKLVALPWRKITLDQRMHCFVLDFSMDRLAASPAILTALK
jgi:sporulation protein YlmC with PRC-barrel domain